MRKTITEMAPFQVMVPNFIIVLVMTMDLAIHAKY